MTAEDLERNLGTIAHSDSEEFKTANSDAQNSAIDIIGQFGVGFYSAFMVAKHVRVVSKAYGDTQAHAWTSDGLEGYEIEDAEREGHGTDVILTLKDDEEPGANGEGGERYSQYLEEWTLRELVRRHSNYVIIPFR